MQILRLDPADTGLARRANAMLESARLADHPELPPVSPERFIGSLTHPAPGSELRGLVAVDDREVRGYVSLYLPTASNTHYTEAELTVHPGHRRRGVGTALMGALLDTARAERRTELVVIARGRWGAGPERSEAGPRFLERHGFSLALTEVDRRLELDSIDPEAERRLWKQARAESSDDYELISWTGRTPEAHLAAICRLDSMIFDEVPLGDVNLSRREIDVDQQRARDHRNETLGLLAVRTIGVHRPSGEPAAHTVIFARQEEKHAQQAITITAPAHRGHRLGMLVKLQNLAQLRERCAHVREIWAGNADTNAHMVAINDRLGFAAVDAHLSYKRVLQL